MNNRDTQEWSERMECIVDNMRESEREALGPSDATTLFCVFHGRGGYDCERKSANETLEVGKQYRVVDVEMHASVTYITLEGEKHSYNTAMFDVDFEALYAWAHPPQNVPALAQSGGEKTKPKESNS